MPRAASASTWLSLLLCGVALRRAWRSPRQSSANLPASPTANADPPACIVLDGKLAADGSLPCISRGFSLRPQHRGRLVPDIRLVNQTQRGQQIDLGLIVADDRSCPAEPGLFGGVLRLQHLDRQPGAGLEILLRQA